MSSNQSHTPSPLGPAAQGASQQQQTRQGGRAGRARRTPGEPSNEAMYWHRRNLESRRREQAQTDPGPPSGSSVLAGEGAGAADVTFGVAPGLTPCPVPVLRISRHYRSDPSPSSSGGNATIDENRLTVPQQAGQDTSMSAENRLTEQQRVHGGIPTHVENRRYVETFQGESEIPSPLTWANRAQPPVGQPYFTPLAGAVVNYNWERIPDSTGNVPTYFLVYPPASASSPPRLATPGTPQPVSGTTYTLNTFPSRTLSDQAGQSSSSSSDEEESRETPAHALDGANDVETRGGAHDGAVPEDPAAYALVASAQDGVATRVEDARPVSDPENPFIGNPRPRIPLAVLSGTFQERQQFLIAATKPALLLNVEELREHFDEANSSRPQDAGAAEETGKPGPALIVAVEEAAATNPSEEDRSVPPLPEPSRVPEPINAGGAAPTIIYAIEDVDNSEPVSARGLEKLAKSPPATNTQAPAVPAAEPAAATKVQEPTAATKTKSRATVAGGVKKISSTAAAAVVNTVRNFGRRRAASSAGQSKHANNSAHDIDDACSSGRHGAAGQLQHPNSSAHETSNDGAADVIYELRSGHVPTSLSDCSSYDPQVRFTYDIDKDPHIRVRRLQQNGARCDIRSQIAPANDLGKDMSGRLVRFNWTEEPEETKNFLSSMTFLGELIGDWRQGVPNPFYGGWGLADGPNAETFTALLAEKADCDVDPRDLALQTPYEARDAPANPNDAGKAQDALREHRYSSFEKLREANRALSDMNHYSETEVDDLGLGASGQSAPKVQSFEPDVTCYLRPASKEDVANIQTIYNHEVTHGTQSRDVHKVTVADITSTLDMCKAGNLPFIVAIAGLEHDIREPKGAVKKWQTGEPEKGELLGFAFLSNYYVGLCGATDATGGSSVRLTIVVHPQHRRKFIGHALMDKMLHLVCPNYAYQDTAAFVDHKKTAAYSGPGLAPRMFRHLLVETMAQEEDQRSGDRFAQFLEGRFGFSKLFELKQSHNHRGSLYNQTTWHREIRPAQPAQ